MPLKPNYDVVRNNFNKTGVAYHKPVDKKRLEEKKKK